MRNLVLILVLVFAGCHSRKDSDFTFYKWNMRESYYLKFNSTDTLYNINSHPFEGKTSYTILKITEKELIQNVLDSISFPKDKTTFDSGVNDGKTFAFILKSNKDTKKVRIHSFAGPEEFWTFGRLLEEIKNKHKFTVSKKKFDTTEMDSMVFTKVRFIKNNGH